jgi:pSer/pThr/pTyr-binding forkhead associated (FHA) protein
LVEGGSRLRRIVVDPLPFRVGRLPGLALVLEVDSVSKEHAALLVRGGELYVRDLGSKNGTFVNCERVSERGRLGETVLQEGDIIHFAQAEFRLGRYETDQNASDWRAETREKEQATADGSPYIRRCMSVPIIWHGEVVGCLYDVIVETRAIDSRYEERKVRGRFASNAGPASKEFWRLAELMDAVPQVNEAPDSESFFMWGWRSTGDWLVTIERRAGSNEGSMAELSLLVERARARAVAERDREGAEQAREDLKGILATPPPLGVAPGMPGSPNRLMAEDLGLQCGTHPVRSLAAAPRCDLRLSPDERQRVACLGLHTRSGRGRRDGYAGSGRTQ